MRDLELAVPTGEEMVIESAMMLEGLTDAETAQMTVSQSSLSLVKMTAIKKLKVGMSDIVLRAAQWGI